MKNSYSVDNKGFTAVETTIAQLQQAIKNQTSDCEQITGQFIKRIQSYDKSTHLNAIILINKNALQRAKSLDQQWQKTHKMSSLHCVPVILKDNFNTADMPTEAGSIALKGSQPAQDAFMVKRLRDAGAIIIAKSNMAEWAFSAYQTISSTHGETLNAYNLDFVPAGSSGGTASAIAANFGVIGMGTDTGNSIRGPAAYLSLVGLRSTLGMTSRSGIVPLLANRDVAGSLTRTVTDAAKTFSVLAGYDKNDSITHNEVARLKTDYTIFLNKSALQGVRLGVMRQIYDTELADFEVIDLMDQAIVDLRQAGAVIIDPFEIKNFKTLSKATGFCSRFRYDLNQYLNHTVFSDNTSAPIKKFQDIIEQKLFSEQSAADMKWAEAVHIAPKMMQPPCVGVQNDPRRKAFLNAVVDAMDKANIDAIIYPSWSNPPRRVGDNNSPHGDNSPIIAPHTGQPAITVPMGYTQGNLPAGLQFLARPFDDGKLLAYAFAYEQYSLHRKAPVLFPQLIH
ncbi:amidase family protein [sulfur-oxidizing endosymbiont of Gigantopelta aegis]|uniref:amidase family protein n=1 Tax=sulfur-oxidizing endosymbiont of Gigantopelta aegis TaxID=2794934 RepID=UPI001FE98E8E|nr:amidase family protein [sulfur-oxidizing endosymbiont of Gigantopelta aegis]